MLIAICLGQVCFVKLTNFVDFLDLFIIQTTALIGNVNDMHTMQHD